MTNPSKHDQYYTQLKVKYLTGLVSTATTSLVTTSSGSTIYCNRTFEVIDDNGNTYHIPAWTY